MMALEECHDKGFFWKSMGMCNDTKEALIKCLREERRKRQLSNSVDKNEKKARLKAKFREIDENS